MELPPDVDHDVVGEQCNFKCGCKKQCYRLVDSHYVEEETGGMRQGRTQSRCKIPGLGCIVSRGSQGWRGTEEGFVVSVNLSPALRLP